MFPADNPTRVKICWRRPLGQYPRRLSIGKKPGEVLGPGLPVFKVDGNPVKEI
jgi:hypothetical protein